MSAVALETPHATPLSRLSEDELMFRDTVRQFAGDQAQRRDRQLRHRRAQAGDPEHQVGNHPHARRQRGSQALA